MNSPAPVIFIGDVALDEYYSCDTWPYPGDKALVKTIAVYTGGSIANAARVHAGLGGETEFISLLNTGPVTAQMEATLAAGGVGVTHMLYDDEISDPRNFIFLVAGEHVVLTPDVDERPMQLSDGALSALTGPGYLYSTLDRARRLRNADLKAEEVLSLLRASGRRLVFDLDVEGFGATDAALIDGAHLVMTNDHGFARTFGEDATDRTVREWLRAHRVEILVRSRAAEGVTAYTAEQTLLVDGYQVPVRDVTGAGDTLGGALVFGLGKGWSLREATELAVAAASRSVMHLGPTGGVAALDDVRAFAAEHRGVRV